jgi:hypothetical protein
MPEKPDVPSSQLNDGFAAALDRAAGTSLESLHTLRTAVREYARRQKQRGVPLDSVMLALSSVLMEAEDDRQHGGGHAEGARDPELARQIRAWCGEDYSG